MSATTQLRVGCDHPRCSEAITVENKRDMDLRESDLPAGWWTRGGWRRLVACPYHAENARKIERAMHEWHKREVDARNAWLRDNPAPARPQWLHSLNVT